MFFVSHDSIREYHLERGRWQPTGVSSGRIPERTSPPTSWFGTGLFGLAGAALLLVQRWRIGAWRRGLEVARPGVLDEDGRVTFADGSLASVDSPASFPPGPVLVRAERPDSAYRRGDPLRREAVSVGTLEEHLAKLRFDVLRCEAAIAAVTCLAGAPLMGAGLLV